MDEMDEIHGKQAESFVPPGNPNTITTHHHAVPLPHPPSFVYHIFMSYLLHIPLGATRGSPVFILQFRYGEPSPPPTTTSYATTAACCRRRRPQTGGFISYSSQEGRGSAQYDRNKTFPVTIPTLAIPWAQPFPFSLSPEKEEKKRREKIKIKK